MCYPECTFNILCSMHLLFHAACTLHFIMHARFDFCSDVCTPGYVRHIFMLYVSLMFYVACTTHVFAAYISYFRLMLRMLLTGRIVGHFHVFIFTSHILSCIQRLCYAQLQVRHVFCAACIFYVLCYMHLLCFMLSCMHSMFYAVYMSMLYVRFIRYA